MKHSIVKEFTNKKRLKIKEIYEFTANVLQEENSKKLRHSIRGSIHALKKEKFITQVGPGEYILSE